MRTLRRSLARSGLAAGLQITEHPRSGRNGLYVVEGRGGPWVAKVGVTTAESWFYGEVGRHLDWVPSFRQADDPRLTLVHYLEDHPPAQTLVGDEPAAAIEALVSLAPLLAELHAWTLPPGAPRAQPALPQLEPVHVSAWLDGTEAAHHVLRSVQRREALAGALRAALRGEGPQGLIHADLKADNILCRSIEGGNSPVVIDWELCGHGPLAWDLGCVVGSVLGIWIDGMDLDDPEPGTWFRHATIPYGDLRAAIHGFLSTYRRHARRDVPSPGETITHAAAWLVVRSWSEALMGLQVNPFHAMRLVIAEGIVRNPRALLPGGER